MGMMGACMGGMSLVMTIIGIAWVVLVVAVVVFVARQIWRRPPSNEGGAARDSALTTLRERFARGEIDRGEYDERRHALLSEGPRWP
ncbi:MAG TPA: SHOCT domain-containing protein [Thermomicrobiales bacterium]|nr:SHOCT domain-containing protein [Thermomicrobiales bacterium]